MFNPRGAAAGVAAARDATDTFVSCVAGPLELPAGKIEFEKFSSF